MSETRSGCLESNAETWPRPKWLQPNGTLSLFNECGFKANALIMVRTKIIYQLKCGDPSSCC